MINSCTKKPPLKKTNLVLAVNVTTYSAPVYVALAKGFWEKENLSITRKDFAAGRFCLEAILGGKADFGTIAEAPMVFAGLTGQKALIAATMASGDNEMKVIARKDHGIVLPIDLKGKKIAALVSTVSEFFLYLFLDEHGMTMSDIKLVNLKPAEMPSALTNGDIDAFTVWEPFVYNASKVLNEKATVFTKKGLYDIPFNIVIPDELAQEYPETVEAILRGLNKAEQFIGTNRKEALEIISKEVGLSTDVLEELTKDIKFELRLNDSTIELMEREAKWAIETGYAPKDAETPDYRSMIYDKALKNLNPKAVSIK
jgi:NitT/TauT family transport system substrate-binding protein